MPSSTLAAPRAASAWPSEAVCRSGWRLPVVQTGGRPVGGGTPALSPNQNTSQVLVSGIRPSTRPMTPRATFPRAARLLRPSEYAAALKGRRIARGALFVLTVPREGTADTRQPEAGARLGMIIGKRMARRAVTRNTIKRVLREAFRAQRHALPPRDFVFRLVAPVEPTSLTALKRQVRTEADKLFQRARTC